MAETAVCKGFIAKSIVIGGREIRYAVYVPPVYDPETPCPAIISLNGKGECGTDGLRQVYHLGGAIMLDVSKWPFIVLFPQKQYALEIWEEHAWEDQAPMVMAILERSRQDYNIDGARLYLTGLSQGGHGTYAIAATHPDLFAAIAPICGWGDRAMAEKLVRMPVWAFHGEDDAIVPAARTREMARWIEEAGGSPKLMVYPGVGHNSWDKAYREENLGGRFLKHRK